MLPVYSFREDRGDGLDLRTLAFGGERVVDRLYVAVRDQWWRTVPLTIVRRSHRPTPAGFEVEIEAVSDWPSHPVDVRLSYLADGATLDAEVTVLAGAPFVYCRIGVCLLLAADDVRGRPATSWHHDRASSFAFPEELVTRDSTDPDVVRFHEPLDRLSVSLASGAQLHAAFEGEAFEFEDQRNWTDASYKAYSVAPREGWPAAAGAGQRFSQRVRLQVEPARLPAGQPVERRVVVGGPVAVVPPVGLFSGRESARSYRPGGGFQELNAQRPSREWMAGHDEIELAVNGAVHAADDDSVLQATALHGALVTQTRALYPGVPVVLAPVDFLDVAGDWRDDLGHYAPHPAPRQPSARATGTFGAAWVLASAARALPAGPGAVRYLDAAVPAGSPAATAVARLAALEGATVLSAQAPAPLAVLAVEEAGAVVLAVVNTGPDRQTFRLPDGQAAALDGFAAAWFGPLARTSVPGDDAVGATGAGSDPRREVTIPHPA